MQKVTGIGGFFFRARDPKAMAQWYEATLGLDITERVWVADGGPTVFAPFRADTDYFAHPGQHWMLCFRVADLRAMVAQLQAAGIEVIERAEWNSEVGTFARIHDPEGNAIELWQPSDMTRDTGG